jgi:O-Antigen ligase
VAVPNSDISETPRSNRPAMARVVDGVVFYALLAVIAGAAIPYGAAEPWWKSLFQCLVFVLVGISVLERLVSRRARSLNYRIFLPAAALIAFAVIQTISWSNATTAGTSHGVALSADVFQTRLVVVQWLALFSVSWLVLSHTSSRKRVRLLVETIIGVGVASAVFGLLRQALQQRPGFGLPNLMPHFGYAQFINSNHFAFLMEMALGLALGLVVGGGVTGKRRLAYLVAAVPMWVALVLANSRGGILSILCQVVFLAALFVSRRNRIDDRAARSTSQARSLLLRAVLVATLLLGALVTVVFVGGDPLTGRIDSLSAELDRETAEKFALRQNIWRATWQLIKDHPVSGVGFGGYWVAIPKYHQASGEFTPQQAHNDYLELLASGGVIGLAIGVWFVVSFAKVVGDKLRDANTYDRAVTFGALAGLLSVAVHSLVDFGLHITINAVVFVVLISLVSVRIEHQRRRRSAPAAR